MLNFLQYIFLAFEYFVSATIGMIMAGITYVADQIVIQIGIGFQAAGIAFSTYGVWAPIVAVFVLGTAAFGLYIILMVLSMVNDMVG